MVLSLTLSRMDLPNAPGPISQGQTYFSVSFQGKDYYAEFAKKNYTIVQNNTALRNFPTGPKRLPGLNEMTVKALEILHTRHQPDGLFLMSEVASIDKQMHTLAYDRALDLESLDELDDTLVLVTVDHGHGFDVMGNVNTHFLHAQKDDRDK
ncbi:alkaline-phosphatase-like protein [Exophiala viscosa]|uniref:alkaline phosphatase n=1 Tax=Exophiala viscosa TaxID=2486360 RepID=A0AAN6DT97_9EURO|nr:alkaline-phosphatase-like protein [Exophiala viscosa]KAI1623350.1 alkaline-phosphatase-like protein [Exophiala viscosa]